MRVALVLLLVPSLAAADTFAAIDYNAALHTSTDPEGVIVRSSVTRVVRVVKSGPERTEIATTASGAQCYPSPETNGLELHLFVKTSELPDVTTRDVTTKFDDGTAATLSRGVAVGAIDNHGERDVTVDGFHARFAIAGDAIGKTFNDGAHVHPQRNFYTAPDNDKALRLDRHAFEIRGVDWPLYVDEVVDLPNNSHLVTLYGTCSKWRLAYQGGLSSGDPAGDEPGYTVSPPVLAVTVVGSTVYWLTGAVAGSVRAATSLTDSTASSRTDRRCFLVPLDGRGSLPLPVCFAAKDLRVAK